jgi:DeoR/GlpR family transcriptional regulator of sugar metabolism
MGVSRYTARRDLQRLEVRGLVAKGEDGRWRATVI